MTTETKSFASTMLDTGSYDSEARVLTVVFQSGREYTLNGVPPEKWEGLKGAFSAGRFFNEQLKGQY